MARATLVNRMRQPRRIRKTAKYEAKRKEIEPATGAQVCHNAKLAGKIHRHERRAATVATV
jgi:hypothetical protein